jgi:FKBP-type peptidyl-prolyl cis-trans isomerase (trigger factor)
VISAPTMTREEIEQKMDELAWEYHEMHNPEIREEIYRLARQLKEFDH